MLQQVLQFSLSVNLRNGFFYILLTKILGGAEIFITIQSVKILSRIKAKTSSVRNLIQQDITA